MAKYGEEKPAAIIDNTDYAYTFYYSLVSIRPIDEYQTYFRVLIDPENDNYQFSLRKFYWSITSTGR